MFATGGNFAVSNNQNNSNMQPNEQPHCSASMTNREIVGRLLRIGHPDLDIYDDESVFGKILDDYADYARLLDAETGNRHRHASDDGLPHLH